MDPDDILHPGPIDASILTQQVVHRTEKVWNDPVGDL